MEREGQLWIGFFALLLGIPLVVNMCSVLAAGWTMSVRRRLDPKAHQLRIRWQRRRGETSLGWGQHVRATALVSVFR